MNWTDDSWTRQENVIAIVDSAASRTAFRIDFDQLWTTRDVEKTGFVDAALAKTGCAPGSRRATARTSRTASPSAIRRPKRRVRICSPVITTGAGARRRSRR